MKRKTLFTILVLVAILVMGLGIMAGCKHKHTFDTEVWQKDATNHWHAATCKHKDEKADVAAHEWNEGTVTKPATEDAVGTKLFTCKVCGQTKEDTIPKLVHTHKYDNNTWANDADYHWHPATCAHTDQKGSVAMHDWDEGVVTIEPDYGKQGEKTFTCTVCKRIKTKPIAALDAKTNFIDLATGVVLGKTYDGQPYAVTAEQIMRYGNGAISFMYKGVAQTDDEYVTVAPTKAGAYTVKVMVEGTDEWLEAEKTFDFTIAQKTLTATASKVYDGKTDPISATLTGVVEGDKVTATVTFESKNVGATVKAAPLDGEDKDNYTLEISAVTAEITKKPLTATANKVYDGSATGAGKLDGVVEGDEITATVTFESKNVGAEVTAVMLDGKDKGNYSLEVSAITAEITKRPLTATADKVYDGNATGAGKLDGVVEGDKITATVTFESKNVGAKVASVMLDGEDKGNYSLEVSAVTAEIAKRALTATANKIYDGTTTNVGSLDNTVSGDKITATVTFESKNVGAKVASVMLDGEDKGNYSLEVSAVTAEITQRPLTATANKVYDGTTTASGVLDNVVSGETLTLVVTFESKNVGAKVASFVLDGAEKANYSLETKDITAAIARKSFNQTIEMSLPYTGTNPIRVDNTNDYLVQYGVLAGDDVIMDIMFDTGAVGDICDTFDNVTISGADKGNYTTENSSITVTVVTRKLQMPGDLIFERGTKEYAKGVYQFTSGVLEGDVAWLVNLVRDVELPRDYEFYASELTLEAPDYYELVGKNDADEVLLSVFENDDFYMYIDSTSYDSTKDVVKVSGTINRGSLKSSTGRFYLSNGYQVEMRALYSSTGAEIESATKGDYVTIEFDQGTDYLQVEATTLISSTFIAPAYRFEMQIKTLSTIGSLSNGERISVGLYKYKTSGIYQYNYAGEVEGTIAFEGDALTVGQTRIVSAQLDAAYAVWVGMEVGVYNSAGSIIGNAVVTSVTSATAVRAKVEGVAGIEDKSIHVSAIEKGDATLTINGGDFIDIIEAVKGKRVTIKVFVSGNETRLGIIMRTGLGLGGELKYTVLYSGSSWVEENYTTTIKIALAKGFEGYTDADGKWLFDGDNVMLRFEVTLEGNGLQEATYGSDFTPSNGFEASKENYVMVNFPSAYSIVGKHLDDNYLKGVPMMVYDEQGNKVVKIDDRINFKSGNLYFVIKDLTAADANKKFYTGTTSPYNDVAVNAEFDFKNGVIKEKKYYRLTIETPQSPFTIYKCTFTAKPADTLAYYKVYDFYGNRVKFEYFSASDMSFEFSGIPSVGGPVYFVFEYKRDVTSSQPANFKGRLTTDNSATITTINVGETQGPDNYEANVAKYFKITLKANTTYELKVETEKSTYFRIFDRTFKLVKTVVIGANQSVDFVTNHLEGDYYIRVIGNSGAVSNVSFTFKLP